MPLTQQYFPFILDGVRTSLLCYVYTELANSIRVSHPMIVLLPYLKHDSNANVAKKIKKYIYILRDVAAPQCVQRNYSIIKMCILYFGIVRKDYFDFNDLICCCTIK